MELFNEHLVALNSSRDGWRLWQTKRPRSGWSGGIPKSFGKNLRIGGIGPVLEKLIGEAGWQAIGSQGTLKRLTRQGRGTPEEKGH